MSTHYGECLICKKETSCASDAHALGMGGCCDNDGPKMEFCSVKCFLEVGRRWHERLAIARGCVDNLFTPEVEAELAAIEAIK